MLADFVVVSGYSGAGKSSAMNVFEDAGYFCVDNLPPAMIRSLATMFTDDGGTVERACVVCDARGGEYFGELAAVLDDLDAGAVPSRVLFLEADDQELLNRYKATRRRHPLARETNVADGVRRERAQLAPIRARADVVVDTTGLSTSALRRKLASEIPGISGRLAVTFGSFGHKNGPPHDADVVLDVRFLPNPHWQDDLRPLTGFDERVIDYVGRDGRLKEFYDRVLPLLEFLLPQYVAEGKSHLVVAIGCTGGRHRSVVIAEDLGAHFRDDPRYVVDVAHRDVQRARVGT